MKGSSRISKYCWRLFVVHFLKDVISIWKIYDLNGNYIRTIELPGKGIVSGFGGEIEQSRTW